MRLRAGLACALIAIGGCAHIPELIRIEVDGTSVEVKKEPAPRSGDEEDDGGRR